MKKYGWAEWNFKDGLLDGEIKYYYENGGNGYLRLMKFYPEKKKITVKTYSPILDNFLINSENQFSIDLEKGKFLK